MTFVGPHRLRLPIPPTCQQNKTSTQKFHKQCLHFILRNAFRPRATRPLYQSKTLHTTRICNEGKFSFSLFFWSKRWTKAILYPCDFEKVRKNHNTVNDCEQRWVTSVSQYLLSGDTSSDQKQRNNQKKATEITRYLLTELALDISIIRVRSRFSPST